MPAVVYARVQNGPYTATVTGPETFVPGWFPDQMPPILRGIAELTASQIKLRGQEAFPWEPMTSRFSEITEVGPGISVVAGASNDDPILPFLNYDVAAHWPPFGPGSHFASWAARHGINARFAAAAYASKPHPGSKAMEKAQEAVSDSFVDELIAGISEVLSQ